MDGHGAALAELLWTAGKFDWMAHADKYPGLCTPDESYHGITYAEKFGKEGAFITKCTAQLMRDLGCMQSPQSAFILNLGLESLQVGAKACRKWTGCGRISGEPFKGSLCNYPGLPQINIMKEHRNTCRTVDAVLFPLD